MSNCRSWEYTSSQSNELLCLDAYSYVEESDLFVPGGLAYAAPSDDVETLGDMLTVPQTGFSKAEEITTFCMVDE
jgi:hypothetical protein